jgi:hydrogenase-4 component F
MNILTIINSACYLFFAIFLLLNNYQDISLFSNYIFVDKLGLFGIFLTCIIFFLSSIYAGGYVDHLVLTGDLHKENLKYFYLALNLLIIFTILTLSSNNLGLFLVFAEVTTLLASLLIILLNIRDNIEAAIKYIFVTSVAMVFTFIGLIFLLAISKSIGSETLNWTELMIIAPQINTSLTTLTFMFIFFGFMAKSGIVPLHTWMPHAYSSAPSVVGSIMSGAVSYIGLFGILRVFSIARQTDSWSILSPVLLAFGVLSMFIGSFSMLQQRNLKKLIAFSSTEQMGFMLIAISIGTELIIYWLLFYMFIHALIKALLFFSAGILHRQYRSNEVDTMFDTLRLQPIASIGLTVGSISILGIPPFGMFLPKFMILTQIILYSDLLLLIGVLFFFVIAISSFAKFDTKLFSNFLVHEFDSIRKYESSLLMKLPILILTLLIFIIGIFIPLEIQNFISSIVKIIIL